MRNLFNRVVAKLRQEPVRVRLYSVIVIVAGYALSRGYVAVTDYNFVLTVVAAVLGVEATRAQVSPTNKAE
jgi:hypothetical protein